MGKEDENLLDVYRREAVRADMLRISCTPATVARAYLGLPPNMDGQTVIDLAAGASSLVAGLVADGADAYGVDRQYSKPPEEIYTSAYKTSVMAFAALPPPSSNIMWNEARGSIESFMQSYKEDPHRYKAANLTKLPFQDETADFTLSLFGLTDTFEDPELARLVMNEAIRITKINGRVILCPVITDPFQNEAMFKAHDEVIEYLRGRGDTIVHLDVEPDISHALPSQLQPLYFYPYSRLTLVRVDPASYPET